MTDTEIQEHIRACGYEIEHIASRRGDTPRVHITSPNGYTFTGEQLNHGKNHPPTSATHMAAMAAGLVSRDSELQLPPTPEATRAWLHRIASNKETD